MGKVQWVLASLGIVMIGVAVWLTVGRGDPARSAAAPPPPSHNAPPVALYVQHDGAALRLHWNADSDAVRHAGSGALLIADGPRQSRLDLTPADLQSGVASYWPESARVDFKLELDGAPAGELEAPALVVREEPRPSPFAAPPKPKPVHQALEEEPKPYTIHEADRAAVVEQDEEEPPKKPSKWQRVTGKIPLLKRLHKH
jgi:hypothetical protein